MKDLTVVEELNSVLALGMEKFLKHLGSSSLNGFPWASE